MTTKDFEELLVFFRNWYATAFQYNLKKNPESKYDFVDEIVALLSCENENKTYDKRTVINKWNKYRKEGIITEKAPDEYKKILPLVECFRNYRNKCPWKKIEIYLSYSDGESKRRFISLVHTVLKNCENREDVFAYAVKFSSDIIKTKPFKDYNLTISFLSLKYLLKKFFGIPFYLPIAKDLLSSCSYETIASMTICDFANKIFRILREMNKPDREFCKIWDKIANAELTLERINQRINQANSHWKALVDETKAFVADNSVNNEAKWLIEQAWLGHDCFNDKNAQNTLAALLAKEQFDRSDVYALLEIIAEGQNHYAFYFNKRTGLNQVAAANAEKAKNKKEKAKNKKLKNKKSAT